MYPGLLHPGALPSSAEGFPGLSAHHQQISETGVCRKHMEDFMDKRGSVSYHF